MRHRATALRHDLGVGALEEAVGRVGDRWTLLLVDALLGGPRRFGELHGAFEGLAPNVLSKRLKALEADGLVVATPYSQRPPRLEYQLTEPGRELAGTLRLLTQWGAGRSASTEPGLHHGRCGTPVEGRWWCPTCDEVVDDDETDDVTWV